MLPCGARGAFAAGSRRSFRVVNWLSDHSPPQSSDRLLPKGARAFSSRWLTGRHCPNEARSVSPRLAHGPSVPGWRTGRQCPDRLALRPSVPLVRTGRQAPLAHGPSVPLLVPGPSVPAALGPPVPGVGYGQSLSLVPGPSPWRLGSAGRGQPGGSARLLHRPAGPAGPVTRPSESCVFLERSVAQRLSGPSGPGSSDRFAIGGVSSLVVRDGAYPSRSPASP